MPQDPPLWERAKVKPNIDDAAKNYASSSDASFPAMAMFTSLENSSAQLGASARACLQGELYPPGETLSVPRRSGGAPRPVRLFPPPVSVVYTALTESLSEVLPSRLGSDYEDFYKVGLQSNTAYVVESDIAACYEYIDHNILRQELVKAQPSSLSQINDLHRLLHETHPRGLGLPQMNSNSDRLADLYISNIVRRMLLRGYDVYSFADDFRILVDDWTRSNECIEELSEIARDVGLVLSQQKTAIWKTTSLNEREEAALAFWTSHLAPYGATNTTPFVSPYAVEELLGVEQNVEGACRLIDAWGAVKDSPEHRPVDSRLEDRFITQALLVAANGHQEIDDTTLLHFVFYQPHHLGALKYVLTERNNADQNDAFMDSLVGTGRQSAWFKLWTTRLLLDLIPEWSPKQGAWLIQQLQDRHEVVRAEAAWAAACRNILTQKQLEVAYRAAGPLTSHVLAACSARLVRNSVTRLISADGPLNKAAAHWAEHE